MQTVYEYVKPQPMGTGEFFGKLIVGLAMFVGILIGALLIVAKFGIGASIGNALLGLGIAIALVFGVMYFVMETDKVRQTLAKLPQEKEDFK